MNRDFRYLLTAVGAPMPGLYIAEEITNNRFKISGGLPGMRVSIKITPTGAGKPCLVVPFATKAIGI
ncbi:MAG TPA: hypothetical protein VLM38_17190 [Blastocatellia bacterium]|nr:hypothetical protein [Blastocatellia bacterium]